MENLSNLKYILSQLKSNPQLFNLTEEDVLRVDKAIEELDLLEQAARINKHFDILVKLAPFGQLLYDIFFKNSS
ncbi:MAG: hypothetical protein GC192_23195 [Bacteroidetes bacterium]|nr:hypothetical protein [Bacteroidota bacterium]